MSFHDIDIVARTIYGEARGEYERKDGGLSSLIAVGNVILNRAQNKKRFGATLSTICQKPYQFSCWLKNDPNRKLIETVDQNEDVFRICMDVAENLVYGHWPDLTKGSDHYHGDYIKPSWADESFFTIKIGQHVFYKLGEK